MFLSFKSHVQTQKGVTIIQQQISYIVPHQTFVRHNHINPMLQLFPAIDIYDPTGLYDIGF